MKTAPLVLIVPSAMKASFSPSVSRGRFNLLKHYCQRFAGEFTLSVYLVFKRVI